MTTEPARSPAARPRPHPGFATARALTSDFWYTLVYLPGSERRSLEGGRRRVWTTALGRAGVGRAEALAEVDRLFATARAAEARGRTPTIRAQAEAVSRRLRLRDPLPGVEIGEALDRNLLRRRVRVAPGARRVLARLADRGIALGLISNVLYETGEGARALIERLDLREPFGATYLSSEHPWAKPSPQPFRMILGELGADPRRSAHIGDMEWDVLGAQRAGLRSLLFTGLHRFESPRPRIPPKEAHGCVRVRRWDEVPSRFGP